MWRGWDLIRRYGSEGEERGAIDGSPGLSDSRDPGLIVEAHEVDLGLSLQLYPQSLRRASDIPGEVGVPKMRDAMGAARSAGSGHAEVERIPCPPHDGGAAGLPTCYTATSVPMRRADGDLK